MTAPLSPTPSAALNFSTPPATASRYDSYSRGSPLSSSMENDESDNSSPFMAHVRDDMPSPQGPSPPKALRPASRIISGSELSPLKILQQLPSQQQQSQQQQQSISSASSDDNESPAKAMAPPPVPLMSPRKMSAPIKRFPVKVSSPPVVTEIPRAPSPERKISLQDAMRENEGLKHAIAIFEDEASDLIDTEAGGIEAEADTSTDTVLTATESQQHHGFDRQRQDEHENEGLYGDYDDGEGATGIDDTMMSTFSTFSSVPNMTMLAQMRSPTKFSTMGATLRTGRSEQQPPMSTSRTPRNGPLPDRSSVPPPPPYEAGNTTNLMDFTEQLRYGAGYPPQISPSRRSGGHLPSSKNTPHIAATPQRHGNSSLNLLDFDIPPMPTPRSLPSITPRELESLKSGFLSEISSLKASLSGKEAEVMSLKTAVGDAEKRVGECMEQLREVQGVHDSLTSERDSWEKRGREMESVLRKVKEEIVLGRREREELEFKLDEAEKRREAAEMMAQEAESKMAGMRAGKASAEAAAAAAGSDPSEKNNRASLGAGAGSNKEVEMAVERVARELHALYKSKHETKVAALKKSYENRWDKRVRELQAQVDELTRENDEMRLGRDATMTRVDPAAEEERKVDMARANTQIRELEAEVDKFEAVVKTIQADNAELRVLLEQERVEKGELVQLAEEMMNMQQTLAAAPPPPPTPAPAPAPAPQSQLQAPPTPSAAATRTPARSSFTGGLRGTPMTARQSAQPQQQENNPATGGANHFRASRGGSGLRAPGSSLKSSAASAIAGPAESRIGRFSHHERTKSAALSGIGGGGGVGGGMGLARPGSGMGMRSGIMSSIEKMGSYRGRAE
ncbi:hypothetical protein B0H63DRAFT_486698 [Podospora didyma]|uniref:Uncharacterized protein n=1 Tax=Podospora didyma TaxID=330526 RepID=A0AAE0K6N2_9PEZI|nr:hypothetical protein B0H63DRAFT_486698 [Podospora didyma]